MNKKLVFLLLFLVATMSIFSLDYTIELTDTYGDGWNGGSVTVNVNGSPVLEDLTIGGGSSASYSFTVVSNDLIETSYTAGSWSTENEYQILNENNEVVAESGQGGATPGNVSYTVPQVIEGTPDAPTLTSPVDGSNNIAVASNLEWTIGENTNTVTLYLADNAEFTNAIIMEENATSPYSYSGLETGTLYYWKVVAINTTNSLETATQASFTTTLFSGDQVVFSGDYVVNQGLPIEPYYGYSVSQSIYPADELNIVDHTITEITYLFNQNSVFTDNIIIYMAHTELTTFDNSTSWIDEGLIEVYNGTLTTSTEDPKITIELDSPFVYNNVDNLLVCVFETTSGYHSGSDEFLTFSVAENRSIHYKSDSTNPSIVDWTSLSGTAKAYLPVTAFTLGEIPQNPIATLSDTELDFGTVVLYETANDIVSITNTGAGTLNITDITITGTNSEDFDFDTDTEGPWALTTGQELVIQVDFTPQADGPRSASLEITDDLARQVHEIALSGTGNDTNIYEITIPYSQTFENEEEIMGWTSVLNSTSSSATAGRYNGSANNGSYSYRVYNSNDTNTTAELISPLVIPDINAYRIRFWAKKSSTNNTQPLVVGKYNQDMNSFTAISSVELTTTYQEFTINMVNSAKANERFAFQFSFTGTYQSIYIDDIILEEIPQNPIATLSDTELDFGTVDVGETGSDLVSISNSGAGTLNITSIDFSGSEAGDFAYQTDTEGPWALTTGQELVIQVDFTPSADGPRSGSLDITDDLGSKSRQVSSVTLTGNGFVMPVGNHHNDPIILTLADEIIENGSTTIYDTYYDFCSSQTVVYKLSLPTEKLMSVSLEGTAWDTKLYIFNSYDQIDQATSANDAWYYNDDESNAGQGGAKSKSRDRATWSEMLETLSPAGDYYIIVTGYNTNNGDYTMTINTSDLPVPGPATSPSPANDAIDQAIDLTLSWTNPDYTDSIDLYFGTPGSKSLAKVLDNVPAVEEHEVTGLAPSTEYNWYVVCRNTSGDTPAENIVTWSFTTIGSTPEAVTYTSPTDAATDIELNSSLTWQSSANASGYKVYLSEDNTFTGITPVEHATTSYALSGLDYETTYYWKVVPYNIVGDATDGILVWSFTTIPDPTIPMPVTIDFEGSTANPAAITLENFLIGTNQHNTTGNVMYKNIYSSSSNGYIQFQSMNNITATSVIALDYRLTLWSAGTVGITSVDGHDYLTIYASTDGGATFNVVDTINGTDHVDTADFTTFTADISAYAGQSVIFRFEMTDDEVHDSWFDIDNIHFGNAPQVTINPGDGSPSDPIVLEDENVELEFTSPNPAGFSLQIIMIPSIPSNNSGLPASMESFLSRTWRVISSVENPGTYNITFDLAGLGITNYGLVRFFKRADSSQAWEDVINLGASLAWNGSKVTISGLDSFSEFVPGIDETLPVTLASFNAVQTTNKFAQINWVTASESEVNGYNLFRGENDNQDQALRVTATMIEASNSPTGASYSFIDDEVEMNSSYYYWLQTIDFDGTSEMFGPITIKISEDNNHDIEEILLGTQLLGNYPNPFNPSTTISFSVAQPQVVTIDVYNIKGQLVRRVFNGKIETPNIKQSVVWNGKDSDNKDVASGIYFTVMKTGNKSFTNKAILMK